MAISSPGIGSNLDINSIITKLMQIENQPLTALAKREASYQAKLTAYGSINGALSSFQAAVQGLNNSGTFMSLKTSSSDGTIATATAFSTAVAGNYAIDVSKIAQSQKLVATGQTDSTAAIGTGSSTTLTFDFGTISGTLNAYVPATGLGGTYGPGATFTSNGSGVKTVTIDSSNNSLSGIRDAINAAKMGVTASIINDGGASPYRLVLSSDNSGSSNSLKISVSGDAALSSLLSQDPANTQNLRQTIAAQNTELTVNGVFVSKASSTLTDVMQGVTLNVLKVGSTSISVTQDSSAASSVVNNFVKAYNDLNKTLKDLSAYNSSTRQGAILQGDYLVRTIQNQFRALLGTALQTGGVYTNLTQIGLTFQKDGTLSMDSGKLQSALSANPAAVAALFAATGNATDTLVSYTGSTTATKPGSYALAVSQPATQGRLVGGSAIADLTITAGVNNALSVTVDGVLTSVTLAAKTYSSFAELAAEIQSRINGATDLSSAGITVAVTHSAGVLTLVSNRYGSASNVTVGGAGAANLLGVPIATAGLDVAGTFNGSTGSGSGQYLSGASGSDAEGLKLLISGGVTGERGTVNFSRGYAYQLNKLIDDMLGNAGTLSSRTEGINRSIKDIDSRREILNRRLADVESRYRAQFTALDVLIGQLSQTSNYLTQQLANLPKVGD